MGTGAGVFDWEVDLNVFLQPTWGCGSPPVTTSSLRNSRKSRKIMSHILDILELEYVKFF